MNILLHSNGKVLFVCTYMFMCACVNTSSFAFACNGLSIIVHSYVYATVKSFTAYFNVYVVS